MWRFAWDNHPKRDTSLEGIMRQLAFLGKLTTKSLPVTIAREPQAWHWTSLLTHDSATSYELPDTHPQ